MFRVLRAFAWMRWRVLINSFERTGARDTLERLSLAVEQLGPIIAALLLVPSLVGMAALSAFAGYALAANPQAAVTFEVLRFLALAASVLAVIGPIVLPVMERPNPVRLLLLPIPRATLYVAQASSTLADPWTLVLLPVAVLLPLGLAAGGALQAAALALAAGLLFLLVIVGISTLTSFAVQLIVRDRRRGELVALAFILLVPLIGILSNTIGREGSRRGRRNPAPVPVERSATAALADRVARQAFSLTPSERYIAATRAGADGRPAAGAAAVLALAATAALLHTLAALAFRRLLALPGSVARRRGAGAAATPGRRVPGLSAGAGAVAIAQMRLVLRTPRGRSTLLSPLVVFIAIAVVSFRNAGPFTFLAHSGIALAAFGTFVSVMATLPFAMNQFAVDGAGLTLELLSPLSDADLLNGKAVANGALAAAPAIVCMLAAFVLFPGGSPALWISLPIAAACACLLIAPAAAALSATFPRVVDLNSVGRGSNAHGVAGLAGVATILVSALPPGGLVLIAQAWLHRPQLTPIFLLVWLAVAFALNRLLLRPLCALLARRRENLGLVSRMLKNTS